MPSNKLLLKPDSFQYSLQCQLVRMFVSTNIRIFTFPFRSVLRPQEPAHPLHWKSP